MLFKNANIYDVRAGTFRLGHLFIENGRIADIGFDGSPQSDAVDMEASYVLPGFVDCHVHLCVDTYNPDASRLWAGAKPGTIALSAARAAYRDDDRRLDTNCPDFWAPGQAGGFY